MSKIIPRIKGYKGFKFNPDTEELFCKPGDKKTVFKIGEKRHVMGNIIPCVNGIHFCREPFEVKPHYHLYEAHFYGEVESFGTVQEETSKIAARGITLLKLIPTIQMLEFFSLKKTTTKTINLSNSVKTKLFNTPELYLQYLKLTQQGKKIKADVTYFSNFMNCYKRSPYIVVTKIY
jgi:hypothetical protein